MEVFLDLHQEVSRSWKKPFSALITNAADFATITDKVGHGYAMKQSVEETLAVHLAPNSAEDWKSCPLLPSKKCRVTSSLVGKSYSATGEAASKLLSAHQAELFKELDKGRHHTGVCEGTAVGLELRATKHTARAVGRSMVGMVTCGSTSPT